VEEPLELSEPEWDVTVHSIVIVTAAGAFIAVHELAPQTMR
jgi:hypothetical protein